MSRNDRKTWTLTDLKLNYWRTIHERQAKKHAKPATIRDDPMKNKALKFLKTNVIAHYFGALIIVIVALGAFGGIFTVIFGT